MSLISRLRSAFSSSPAQHILHWDARVDIDTSAYPVHPGTVTFKALFVLEGPRLSKEATEQFERCIASLRCDCRDTAKWYEGRPGFNAAHLEARTYHWKATLETQTEVFASDMRQWIDLSVESDISVWSREVARRPSLRYESTRELRYLLVADLGMNVD